MRTLSLFAAALCAALFAVPAKAASVSFFTTVVYKATTCANTGFCFVNSNYTTVLSGAVDIADPLQDQAVSTADVEFFSVSPAGLPSAFAARSIFGTLDSFVGNYVAPTAPGSIGMIEIASFEIDYFINIGDFFQFIATETLFDFQAIGSVSQRVILERGGSGPIVAATNTVAPPVPLPAGLALILTGIAGLGLVARRG